MHNNFPIRRLTLWGMLVAVAFVLSWLEFQFSPVMPMPGMKLGLTNIVVLISLYKFGEKDAVMLNFIRIILAGITFGSVFSILYSLVGGILSCLVMILIKKSNAFGIVGVSIAGGISHNIGQILVAMAVLHTYQIFYYLIFLLISGTFAGVIIGILGGEIMKGLSRYRGDVYEN